MPAAEQLEPGSLLVDRYRIESVIGSGGMAVVYRATDTRLDLPVAVKVLRPQLRRKADIVHRFLLEARLQARLKHPNIVNVTNVEERDEVTFIVMELLKGMTLADYAVAKRGLGEKEALELLIPVCDAVATAHAQDVIHRDLKPSNIFLAEDSRQLVPKLMDFGVAREVDSSYTSTTTLLGTLPYMSFELVQSARNASPQSDVYALGVTLFELLTGRHPIQARTLQEYIVALMNTDQVPSLRSARPDISPELDAVAARALRKAAAERYADAAALAAALRELPLAARVAPDAAPRRSTAHVTAAAPRSDSARPEGLRRLESTYAVRGELGTGPLGVVYHCTSPDGTPLAVKLLRPDRAGDPRRQSRFLGASREQQQLALETPFVQPIHALHPDFTGIAAPRPDGGATLAEMLATYGRFDPGYSIELFILLADGLKAAHDRGIRHGHLHPGNIFLARQPDGVLTPWLMDFGHALLLEPDEIDALEHSLPYLAPEIDGQMSRTTSTSDVFGLGMTLFRTLCGQLPYEATTLAAQRAALANPSVIPDLRALAPHLPADLASVVGWCLSIAPERRYNDIGEVRRDLLAVRANVLGY